MSLINYQISHVPLELYECRFVVENEGKSHPLIQGVRHPPIMCRHISITWIGGSPSDANQLKMGHVSNQGQGGPQNNVWAKEEGEGGQPMAGRPPWSVDGPWGPLS